jgi:DNA-binding NtrC family response regulator
MACVLVTEDEMQVRVLAEGIIQRVGYQSLTAASFEEALALVDTDQPIDLLFTDIQLFKNDQGGIELAQEALKRRPGLRVLYTTGAGVTDGMRALFVEGSRLLNKPYRPEQLTAMIGQMLGPS